MGHSCNTTDLRTSACGSRSRTSKIRHVHRPRCKRGVASAPFDDLKKTLDENARLYFFVKMHSEIVSAVGNEQQVCVTDADPSTDS